MRIIDTTLRDGEQKAGVVLTLKDKINIARKIDKTGIYQIEAGIPAMGGDEKESVMKIAGLSLFSKISAWNRMKTSDIDHSMDCGVDIIHISVPSSDLQIKFKLRKDRKWVIDQMRKCVAYAKNKGFTVNVGLEDASRGDLKFLTDLCLIAEAEGVEMIRYADTVGILYPERIYNEISYLADKVRIDLGVHFHNDFGMAVANSVSALKAGVKYVDCTFGGIGERAGNCSYIQFLTAMSNCFNMDIKPELAMLLKLEKEIMKTMGIRQLA